MATARKNQLRYVGPDASKLENMLATKFAAPQYAFLAQVRDCTGVAAARTADALALGLWPSRGIHLHGFEIKVSRNDWLKELKQPEKAEAICQYCDRWWVVVSRDGIVLDGELPPTWGLMIASGNGLRTKTEAPHLDAKPLDKDMLAGILRKASEAMISTTKVEPMIVEARKQAEASAKKFADFDYRQLKEAVAAFEAASGVLISDRWTAGNIGAAVKLIRECGLDHAKKSALRLRNLAAEAMEKADECLAALETNQ